MRLEGGETVTENKPYAILGKITGDEFRAALRLFGSGSGVELDAFMKGWVANREWSRRND